MRARVTAIFRDIYYLCVLTTHLLKGIIYLVTCFQKDMGKHDLLLSATVLKNPFVFSVMLQIFNEARERCKGKNKYPVTRK